MGKTPTCLFAVAVVAAAGAAGLACSTAPAPTPARARDYDEEEGLAVSQAITLDRTLRPSPGAALTAEETAKFVPLPDAPPVLGFHQVCPDTCAVTDKYGISRVELARTMLVLKAAGYTSISPSQYLQYLRADWNGLPQKPILITFDDGRLDAYQGADAILQATGMRATMFIITSRPDSMPGFMNWSEVAAAQASGRWDIQLHAHGGHKLVPVTVNGSVVSVPFYAYKLDGETFDQWKARAEGDILTGVSQLRARVPGYQPLLFACPYGAYGQQGTNDPAIAIELSAFLTQQFGAWFAALPLDFTLLGTSKIEPRLTVINTGTAESVYGWLRNTTLSRARTPAL